MIGRHKNKQTPTVAGFLFQGGLLLAAGVFCASVISVLITRYAALSTGFTGTFLLEKGPDAIARRVLLAAYIVVLFFMLKRYGWNGLRDTGFVSNDPETPARRTALLAGLGIGIISMAPVLFVGFVLTPRFYNPITDGSSLPLKLIAFAGSGIAVSLIEETICRGMFFRTLTRTWGFWTAAILTSFFFAIAHFLSPAPEAFTEGPLLNVSFNVFISIISSARVACGIRLLNLTLLGIALCAFVKRTGTIWMPIGAHAVWVWIIKTYEYLTHLHDHDPAGIITGRRSDGMDSVTTALMLSIMVFIAFRGTYRKGVRLRAGKTTWHVLPEKLELFSNWITSSEMDETGVPAKSGILKKYPGCTVTDSNGFVFKKYTPRSIFALPRFALKKSRAKKAFLAGRSLMEKGVPVPEQTAWGATKQAGVKTAEFLVSKKIENSIPMDIALTSGEILEDERHAVIQLYARLIASFHKANFSNRDLKDENVLLTGTHGNRKAWAVDLDGVKQMLFPISIRRAQRDLYRVGQSLKSKGWLTGETERIFFEKYNLSVPKRLNQNSFPS